MPVGFRRRLQVPTNTSRHWRRHGSAEQGRTVDADEGESDLQVQLHDPVPPGIRVRCRLRGTLRRTLAHNGPDTCGRPSAGTVRELLQRLFRPQVRRGQEGQRPEVQDKGQPDDLRCREEGVLGGQPVRHRSGDREAGEGDHGRPAGPYRHRRTAGYRLRRMVRRGPGAQWRSCCSRS